MILPIVAYGDNVLKRKGKEIDSDYTNLKELIGNMYETMYKASGIGLAAPQIGLSIRLFIVDSVQMESKEDPKFKGIKKVFINPTITHETGEEWKYEEGCLSIPGVRGDVYRKAVLKIKYQDENFEWKEESYDDINARVIQHEYDHIEGILFTEKLAPLKRQMIQKKLQKIMKGDVSVNYKMKFSNS
ncbi:MAG: peptide deformylase [Chitinophagales bacterium]|nr:peptide deformylase [Chitinophagales bacterium]